MIEQSSYTIGQCADCEKNTCLKDGICLECSKKERDIDIPDFLKSLFN